jgi:hypothetical protein
MTSTAAATPSNRRLADDSDPTGPGRDEAIGQRMPDDSEIPRRTLAGRAADAGPNEGPRWRRRHRRRAAPARRPMVPGRTRQALGATTTSCQLAASPEPAQLRPPVPGRTRHRAHARPLQAPAHSASSRPPTLRRLRPLARFLPSRPSLPGRLSSSLIPSLPPSGRSRQPKQGSLQPIRRGAGRVLVRVLSRRHLVAARGRSGA